MVVGKNQLIVAVGVTREPNDVQQLKPILQGMARTLEAAGIQERPRVALADAGYRSEHQVATCARPEGLELLNATTIDWNNRRRSGNGAVPVDGSPRGWVCWSGCSASA